MENKFNFLIPIDDELLEKAAALPLDDESRYDNMILFGEASDDSEDIEGEILEPQGYVIDRFLESGYINYEHLAKRSPKFIIGEPIEAKIVGNKFMVKAKLWKDSQVARDLYDKVLEMKRSGSKRRPAWSIEGKSLLKDPINPKRIKRALITNIAVTFNPVNGNSWADIAKGTQKQDFIETEYDVVDDVDFIFEFEKEGKKFRVGKDYQVFEVKKSMTVDSTKPLMPESLDKQTKPLTPGIISKSIDNILKLKSLGCVSDDFLESFKVKIKEIL